MTAVAPGRAWWHTTKRASASRLAHRLVPSMGLAAAPTTHVERTYLDTYDWRLFDAQHVLVLERGDRGAELVLQDRESARSDVRVPVAGAPTSAADLPAPLRLRLGKAVRDRTLLEVGNEQVDVWPLRLEDDEGKTVARVDVERVSNPSSSATVRVELVAVRGYEREAKHVRALLDSQADLQPGVDPVVRAVRAAGAEPGVGPIPDELELAPRTDAALALSQVLQHELAVVIALEDGVRRDLDPDMLHEFRIAIRRTRTVIRLAKRHLPDKVNGVWGPEWRWLAGTTSTPRDLDVLLEEIDRARADLGVEGKRGFDEVLETVRRQRAAAQDQLSRALAGDRYGTLKRGWTYELAQFSSAPEDGKHNARELAHELTARAAKQLASHAKAITPDSPADAIHDIRKRGKRLRYALDIFGGLLPSRQATSALKAMKQLQDALGEFNDYEVHREWLARLLDTASMSTDATAAGRRLIARYEDRVAVLRPTIDARLREFRTVTIIR
ncbi:MAG TPA: CHAD domain-containing protein [Acidimicrobiales bacterium]|nr:CHAD domain-containing protein [Acidimicrobiales bacterium]